MSIARRNVLSLLWLALVMALVFGSPVWADPETSSGQDLWQFNDEYRGAFTDEDEDDDEDEDGDIPTDTIVVDGVSDPAEICYDQYDVPCIYADTEGDAIFLQGYLHAKDRFFQMDLQRRTFSGTLAELFGPAALPSDVQFRTLGLRRAAEASLPVQTPEILAWLNSYAAGVNAYLNDPTHPLPPEYFVLETTKAGVPPWTVVDSLTMVKGLAAGLSFNTSDIDRTLALLTFQAVLGQTSGFILHTTDLFRVAPFDSTLSIPGGGPAAAPGETPIEADAAATAGGTQELTQRGPARRSGAKTQSVVPGQRDMRGADVARGGRTATASTEDVPEMPDLSYINPGMVGVLEDYRDAVADIPFLKRSLRGKTAELGSNWWTVSGALTESGFPMIANDPHLSLDVPATFYEVCINAEDTGLKVNGVSFPGAPGVVIGCGAAACWGATVNAMDVTDVYQEVVIAQPLPGLPPGTPTHTIYQGASTPTC
jgi:penicillin amidase